MGSPFGSQFSFWVPMQSSVWSPVRSPFGSAMRSLVRFPMRSPIRSPVRSPNRSPVLYPATLCPWQLCPGWVSCLGVSWASGHVSGLGFWALPVFCRLRPACCPLLGPASLGGSVLLLPVARCPRPFPVRLWSGCVMWGLWCVGCHLGLCLCLVFPVFGLFGGPVGFSLCVPCGFVPSGVQLYGVASPCCPLLHLVAFWA